MAQIYRITHIKNLPFILDNGSHCPNSNIRDSNFVSIGFPTLIEYRNERLVPIEPGGTLADYVPFYFTVRSPMLYVISQANNPEVIHTNQEDIVYLVSDTERLIQNGVRFIFTDRHAKLDYAEFYNRPSDLSKLNWDIIKNPQWGRQYGAERKEIKQAECLIHQHLPIGSIMGIACKNQASSEIIQSLLLTNHLDIVVKIKSEWYF